MLPPTDARVRTRQPTMSHQDRSFSSADGLRLYYRDFPGPAQDAPTVLCLPGLTRNSRDFIAIATLLQARFRVLAADLRGRGLSQRDPAWEHYQPGTYVADSWRLLDHAGVERCAILGTSLGGLMAMLMASERPDRIAGIVLNDVGPEVAPAGIARIMEYVGRQPAVASWEEAAAQCREAYAVALPDYGEADWLDYARRSYRENEAGVPVLDVDPNVGRALREVGGTLGDPWEIFAAIRCPILVLHGERSDILVTEIIERMRAIQPLLEVVTVPGRGHVPQLDEPVVVAALERFFPRLFPEA